MDIQTYLTKDVEEVYRLIISKIMDEPKIGHEIVETLTKSSRYEKEHEFRLMVDVGKVIYYNIYGNYDAVIPLCKDIIERASSYKMWGQLVLGYNALGNAYFGLGMYEKAIEYYLLTIHNEKKYGLNEMTSVAYNNLGLIYSRANVSAKANEYLILALEALERGGSNQLRYREKKTQYLSNIVMNLCSSERLDKVKCFLDQLEEIIEEKEGKVTFYSYFLAKMYHAFYTRNFERAKEAYFQAKESVKEEGVVRQLILLVGYISLCEMMQLDYDFYIDELIEIEGREEIQGSIHSYIYYDSLRKYYKKTGNREKYDLITDAYISSVKLGLKAFEKQQAINLEIVEDLVKKGIDAEDISGKNTELKRMADEAIKNRFALEKAYHKIGIINELGRKLTATTDLHTVVEIIHNNLKQNIPFDVFLIMVPDEERKGLTTSLDYSIDKCENSVFIPFDKEGSIFVDCYKTGKIISSWDKEEESKFKNQHQDEDRPSAIFFPLIVDKKTIGVCSVQYKGARAYSEYHLKFLEDAAPYLSIALNNAFRSRELEKEIKSHLETQRKLREVNESLQKMYAIDGLTEINQRRVFDEKIMELLYEASYERKSASILMIDIDNFKSYNDSFGHLEGDGVLKRVATVFRDVMEIFSGLSARFGGEEFIGAFTGFSAEESFLLADRIRQEIEHLHIVHPKSEKGVLTISIGVAITYHPNESMKSELMRVADESLYKAKNNGKNQVVITEI